MFSTSIFACENINSRYLDVDVKKSQLRFYITIYHSNILNEIKYGNKDYFNSLLMEVKSFKKDISEEEIKRMFFAIKDPFDLSIAITKALN